MNDRFPIDELYEEKQLVDDETFVFGQPVSVGTVEDPIDPRRGAHKPLESTSETVRDIASRLQNEPALRTATNRVLGTLTGGVITLDTVDEHLKQMVEGRSFGDTPLGQKLKTSEVLKLLDPAGNLAEAFAREQATRDGLPPELADKVASTIGLLAGALTPGSLAKKAPAAKKTTEVFLNSLFSNPASHVANVTTNALVSAWAIPERFLAATASAAEALVTLGARPRQVFFGESAAMLFGMLSSATDAIREAGKAFRTGKEAFGPGKLSELSEQGLKVGDTGVAGGVQYRVTKVKESVLDEGIGFWGTVWRSPTRALQAEDAFAKTVNYQGELYAQAYREAMYARRARAVLDEGGETTKFLDDMKNFVQNPSGEIQVRAKEFALAHTFNRELDELGPFISNIGSLGQSLSELSLGALPIGRLVVPIVRTPTNLVHFTAERTPVLNILSSTWRSDVRAGGAARSLAMGKMGGGATLAAAMTYYAGSGLITGGGPIDDTVRRNLTELTGWQPYSIRIGDTYYAYDRLGPLGSMLGIMADYAEVGGQWDDRKLSEVAQAVWLAASRNLTSKIFLEGASDLFNALHGDNPSMDKVLKTLVRTTTPGVVRFGKKVTDDVAREVEPGESPVDPEEGAWKEVREIVNRYKSETPGFSATLPARRNLWGDAIKIPAGLGPDSISPVYTSQAKPDPAGNEISRLRLGIGRAPRVILGKDPDAHDLDEQPSPLDTGIELTANEYDEFVRLAGNELKIRGLGLHDKLNEVVTTDERYLKASDEMKGTIIRRMVLAYRQAATVELLKNNEALMDAFKARVGVKAKALSTPAPTGQQQQEGLRTLRGR